METQEKEVVSLQDENIRLKFRTLYENGKNVKEICELLGIEKNTFDVGHYRNTYNLREFMRECKKARFLKLTEEASEYFMAINKDAEPRLQAIKQKESEFIRETLLKDEGYTKRSEVIGLNINKNEPLDEDQQAKLDKILGK